MSKEGAALKRARYPIHGDMKEHNRKIAEDRRKSKALVKDLNIQKPKGLLRRGHAKTIKQLAGFLTHTLDGHKHKFSEWQHLSEKQIAFAREYEARGRRNIIPAMRAAGYESDFDGTLRNMAVKTMAKEGFDELLDALEFERKARMKISVDDVVVWFNKIASAAMETGDFTNANRAMENLARYLQMFVERKEITHKVVHNKDELDARIAELTMVLKEAEPDIAARIRAH